jgi:hypothetical protein
LCNYSYGWLANLWIAFSVTVDIATFGLPNLSKIAREGNAAAEFAETAEEAKEIKKVADEANAIVAVETGKDVAKMSERQFERFIEKAEKLEDSKSKEKITLDAYEKLGLISKTNKEFNGIKYDIFEYSNEIVWKVDNPKFTWNNQARLWGGELEFDFNTYGVSGLGQKWTEEAFELFGNKIKSIKVEWKQLPEYPGGESLGYKQFTESMDNFWDVNKAVESTTFFKTMKNKDFSKIKSVSEGESIVVILIK